MVYLRIVIQKPVKINKDMKNKTITVDEAKAMDYVGCPTISTNPFTKEVTATVKCEEYDDKGRVRCFPHIFTIKG